jgi:hypothetical protein
MPHAAAFATLLDRFAHAVGARDTEGLAALFATDGVYDDYFFGPHRGRESIAHMLDRFYVGGEDFVWQFLEPAFAGSTGYARYCFSYRSREPESRGQLIVFEGTSCFRLRDGLIAHYSEVFDRGVAFTQLGYAPERIVKLLGRYAQGFRQSEGVKRHEAWRASQGKPAKGAQ